MSKVIKITPDEEGRAYLRLYGSKIEVTGQADKKGKGEITAFGEVYRFQIEKGSKKTEVEDSTPETEPEPTLNEAPVEAEEVADEN